MVTTDQILFIRGRLHVAHEELRDAGYKIGEGEIGTAIRCLEEAEDMIHHARSELILLPR